MMLFPDLINSHSLVSVPGLKDILVLLLKEKVCCGFTRETFQSAFSLVHNISKGLTLSYLARALFIL